MLYFMIPVLLYADIYKSEKLGVTVDLSPSYIKIIDGNTIQKILTEGIASASKLSKEFQKSDFNNKKNINKMLQKPIEMWIKEDEKGNIVTVTVIATNKKLNTSAKGSTSMCLSMNKAIKNKLGVELNSCKKRILNKYEMIHLEYFNYEDRLVNHFMINADLKKTVVMIVTTEKKHKKEVSAEIEKILKSFKSI